MWFDKEKASGFADDSQVGNAVYYGALMFCAAVAAYLSLVPA